MQTVDGMASLEPNSDTFLGIFSSLLGAKRGTRWRSWLRHCVTSRKVAGSIPDWLIEIFRGHNPSSYTLKWVPGIFPGGAGKRGRCVGLTTWPPSCADCLEIWLPRPPGILGPSLGLLWYCFTLLLCATKVPRVLSRYFPTLPVYPLPPASCAVDIGSLLWARRPRRDVDHPPPSRRRR